MNAAEMTQAADDARRLLRGFRAFEEVAKALDAAGSALQAKEEAEKALAAIAPQLMDAQAELIVFKAQVKMAKQDAKDIVAKANEAADGIRLDATIKAEQIAGAVEVAKADAFAQITDAADRADAELQSKQAQRDALGVEVLDLEARADKARKYLAKLAE